MPGFALGELDLTATREMRAHLALCPECMDHYRGTMQAAASFGRKGKQEREQRAIERQKSNLHQKHFGPREKPKPSGRQFRLRLLLMPAFVIFLLTRIGSLGAPAARVELVAARGVVKVDDVERLDLDEPYLILPGRWLVTAQFAKARVEAGVCDLEFGSDTTCLVESARPVRLRIERGRVDVDGSVTIITVLGLLEVTAGAGRITLDSRGLHMEPQTGVWNFMNKNGEQILALGREVTIAPPAGVSASMGF